MNVALFQPVDAMVYKEDGRFTILYPASVHAVTVSGSAVVKLPSVVVPSPNHSPSKYGSIGSPASGRWICPAMRVEWLVRPFLTVCVSNSSCVVRTVSTVRFWVWFSTARLVFAAARSGCFRCLGRRVSPVVRLAIQGTNGLRLAFAVGLCDPQVVGVW